MHKNLTQWEDFKRAWDGSVNFLMSGECIPFNFDFPPIDKIVSEMRYDEFSRICIGSKGEKLDIEDISNAFQRLNIEEALSSSFCLAHFELSSFDKPGGFLEGFHESVVSIWTEALLSQGFTFDRCYPIVFISGPNCSTNYHMDFSHVLAWQIYGTKKFSGLKDVDQWVSKESRVTYDKEHFIRPKTLNENDALTYEMKPNSFLWNTFLTPHWVEASDKAAMSINLSHGGLRLNGKLCPFEDEYKNYCAKKE
ncbi:MAG: hypothetical protein COA79_10200 [Planctomycetota bacterium]|nr:MAG: hypothetical protein COA79_10200 [Planctomycetota bacterium]